MCFFFFERKALVFCFFRHAQQEFCIKNGFRKQNSKRIAAHTTKLKEIQKCKGNDDQKYTHKINEMKIEKAFREMHRFSGKFILFGL